MNLSVIIPVYNPDADMLVACLRSVLSISSLSIEVIVVDDGSTKTSEALWGAIATLDSRIQIIRQINGGVSVARNRGLKVASGDYVTFVDCDDLIVSEWYEKAFYQAESCSADIVYGKVQMCDRNRAADAIRRRSNFGAGIWQTIAGRGLWRLREELMVDESNWLPNLPYLDHGPYAKLFRRDVVSGRFFPEGIAYSEDNVFNHQVLSCAKLCIVTNELAYFYIQNEGSVTHKAKDGILESFLKSHCLIAEQLPIDNQRINEAFALRVLFDLWMGFGMELFYAGGKKTSLFGKILYWDRLCHEPVVRKTLSKCRVYHGYGYKSRGKYLILRHLAWVAIMLKAMRGCR